MCVKEFHSNRFSCQMICATEQNNLEPEVTSVEEKSVSDIDIFIDR